MPMSRSLPSSYQVGFKENIFTETSGIVGFSGALNEFTFGTIIQRELHVTLGARLHYGHPDCFDFSFVLTQGGTSKMSKTINVSEDIFGALPLARAPRTPHTGHTRAHASVTRPSAAW